MDKKIANYKGTRIGFRLLNNLIIDSKMFEMVMGLFRKCDFKKCVFLVILLFDNDFHDCVRQENYISIKPQ